MFHAAGFGWRLARPTAGFLFGNEGETSLAIVFPLAFPSTPAPRSVVWRPQSVVARTESPFSLSQQIQAHQGQRWVVEMDFPPMTRTQAEEFTAFILSLNGMEGTFLLPPFGGKTARGVPAGTPQIDREAAAGTQAAPITAGWNASITGLLKKGDFLQFAKNYLTQAKAFDHADWGKFGNGGAAAPTVTPNATAAPNTAVSADQIDFPATGVGESSDISQATSSPPSVPGQTFDFGLWLKAGSALSIDAFLSDNPFSESADSQTLSITTTWKEFVLSGTFSGATNAGVKVLLRNIASQSAKTIFAWGAYLSSPQANTLHKVLVDGNSTSQTRGIDAGDNSAGIAMWPDLRHFLESSPVAFSNMTGVFRLAQNENPWDINTAMHFGISLVVMEAVP